jgi:hypothetical protein
MNMRNSASDRRGNTGLVNYSLGFLLSPPSILLLGPGVWGTGFRDRYRGFHLPLSENAKIDTLKHAKAPSLLPTVIACMCPFQKYIKQAHAICLYESPAELLSAFSLNLLLESTL